MQGEKRKTPFQLFDLNQALQEYYLDTIQKVKHEIMIKIVITVK